MEDEQEEDRQGKEAFEAEGVLGALHWERASRPDGLQTGWSEHGGHVRRANGPEPRLGRSHSMKGLRTEDHLLGLQNWNVL